MYMIHTFLQHKSQISQKFIYQSFRNLSNLVRVSLNYSTNLLFLLKYLNDLRQVYGYDKTHK